MAPQLGVGPAAMLPRSSQPLLPGTGSTNLGAEEASWSLIWSPGDVELIFRGLGVLKPALSQDLSVFLFPTGGACQTSRQGICHRKAVSVASSPERLIQEFAGYQV